MPAGKPYTPDDHRAALAAVAEHGTVTEWARAAGIPRGTADARIQAARRWQAQVSQHTQEALSAYNFATEEMTPAEAWAAGDETASRTIAAVQNKQWRAIKRKGPFCLFHTSDEHVDDNSSLLRLIEADVARAKGMDAITCHGGDVINNWPLAGRLAKKWAEQQCTLPQAFLRVQHFIQMLDPDVWTMGNHLEMNPLAAQIVQGFLPKKTITDHWTVRFIVKVPGGRDCRVALSHKFQKGSSWFHKTHGHIRELLEAEPVDVLMDGHLHCDGVMDYTLPERQIAACMVASGGYKVTDEWAARISRGGNDMKLRGRCHFIIVDPYAAYDEDFAKAFKSPDQAETYLNGLQNLRAV